MDQITTNDKVTVSSVVQDSLSSYIEEEVCEYITQTLSENPNDEDAREAIEELLRGSIDESEVDNNDPESIIRNFLERLSKLSVNDINDGDTENNDATITTTEDVDNLKTTTQKLTKSIKLKEHDIQTFASGLKADHDNDNDDNNPQQSSIASFYANMIDISSNEAVVSERKRRKEKQKALRMEMEETERKRALQEAMDVLGNNDTTNDDPEELLDAAQDNSEDVHFKNFDLPNLRGGGPDLLHSASLTLAKGRRYGLMGRNGCGKTTLMTFMAQRKIRGAIPKNMTMLLVRQEIIGNEWTALETVLKSDVKREGIKRFIKWCEDELGRLDKCAEEGGHNATNDDNDTDSNSRNNKKRVEVEKEGSTNSNGESSKKEKGPSSKNAKGRLKLQQRKKDKMRRAARAKVNATSGDKTSKVREENVEKQKNKLSDKLVQAYQKLAQIEEEEGSDPEPRARKVLIGMGFTEEMQSRPTSQLSGGWRMRVSLSCALFAEPSLLLLDEPSNHLDLESCMFLEQYLTTKFKGTLVVVSHDRHFLNEVVTDVAHFYRNRLATYKGDITNFENVREEEKQRQIRLRENQEAKKAHLQKYIDLHSQAGENGVKAARQRKSKMKKLDKVGVMAQEGKRYRASYDGDAEEVEEYQADDKVELIFPDPGGFDNDILKLERATFGYTKDKILFHKLDLSINMKSRVALLGRNGCGKTSLIELIIGKLKPLSGQAKVDKRAKVEYLAQHQLEQLDPDGTPMQTMIERYPGDGSNGHTLTLRRHLANFGLGGEVLPHQQIHTMSGGQKCRLCLAAAMYRKPHLLILDEPTNHLDWETCEALIEAIKTFKGGVLLVSHDQYLLTSVCNDMYVLQNGNLELLRYGMNSKDAFEQYKKAVILGRR